MTSVVRFRTSDGEYAVDVEHACEVRNAAGVVPIPSPAPGIVGLLPRDSGPLTVMSTLGGGRDQILVLDAGTGVFGLLVEEVVGVLSIDAREVGPPPVGQDARVVTGVINVGGSMVLLVDAKALAPPSP